MTDDFDYGDLESAPTSHVPEGIAAPRVAQLCQQLARAEQDVKQAEAALKAAKALVHDLEEKLIPGLLTELGTEHFKVPGGAEVRMTKEVTASLPVKDPERRRLGIQWLERNGHADIVKYQATVDFAKGDSHTAKAFEALVASWERHEMIDCVVDKDVHHGTLGATVREMYENGEDFPKELLGFHERRVAKLVKRKK